MIPRALCPRGHWRARAAEGGFKPCRACVRIDAREQYQREVQERRRFETGQLTDAEIEDIISRGDDRSWNLAR